MRHLVSDHPLQLIPAERAQEPFGHRDAGVLRAPPRRKGVGILVRHHPDARPREPGGDGHLLHDVDVLALVRRGGFDDLPRARGPQHLLRSVAPRVPADTPGDERGEDADEGDGVLVGAPGVAGQQEECDIPAEADPGEERDEAHDQPPGPLAVRLLLFEEVGGSGVHAAGGLPSERSTFGTARSAASSIAHSSAGDAFARPATRLVGIWACLVLYWVATSL